MLRHRHAPDQRTGRLIRQALSGFLAVASLTAMAAGAASAQTAPGVPVPQSPTPMAAMPAPAVPAPAATPAAGTGAVTGVSLQGTVGKDKAARIEAHIARLHGTLKITAAQEPLWQSFAGAMRQNVVQMEAVYAKRQHGYGSMNAVQDLQSYGEVEEANARNVQQLLPPFQALYDSFSPEQKKTADTTFLRYTDKAVKKPG